MGPNMKKPVRPHRFVALGDEQAIAIPTGTPIAYAKAAMTAMAQPQAIGAPRSSDSGRLLLRTTARALTVRTEAAIMTDATFG